MKYLFFIFLLCAGNLYCNEEFYIHKQVTSVFSFEEKQISYYNDGQELGFLYFVKIMPHTYVIYSFYIFPEWRNRGYGTKLLLYACSIIKKAGGAKIFIQPGPFELDDSIINEVSRKSRLQKLVRLYQRAGFHSAKWSIKKLAAMLYPKFDIVEDPSYLMEKCISK
jgi:ribosomal protein S18 acetylase RimI-like enzyme